MLKQPAHTKTPALHDFTKEQSAIINSTGNTTINAVAGSGKTTTIIEYAAARPAGSKILYLAFNKSVKLEASRKFAERGLRNVKVETAHSLAYRYIMPGSMYRVKSQGYKINEIADLLNLSGDGGRHTEFIIANHISKFIMYFCNSDKSKVQDLNYLDTITDDKAKNFVRTFYKYIEDGTRLLLAKMDKGEIEITHDFYLKKFQLSNPVLPYDYILFDEGQDASAAMLDIFLKQNATKVIVGDSHQQIYGWRHAVNSLAKTSFSNLQLSTSFRFPQAIADLATGILAWKERLGEWQPVQIFGKGSSQKLSSKATIARSNLGLLLHAINYITDNRKVKHIYFEGNINSYTYADEGASLYDVLSLYNGNHDMIRDKLIRSMNSMDDLEEYIESTEDAQLSMMVEVVNEYGNEITGIIKSLKNLHTGDEERNKAEMIFSTVHRAKGMEYDSVFLVNDFISESKLERSIHESKTQNLPINHKKLNEEINLLYVGITRAKHQLHIPEMLVPKGFPVSPHIQIIKLKKEEDPMKFVVAEKQSGLLSNKRTFTKKPSGKEIKEKAYTVEKKRETHKDAYKPWTAESDQELIYLYESDNPLSAIAFHFGRTKGAIVSRLKKLNNYPVE
jgi:F-box protein, helicase, 18